LGLRMLPVAGGRGEVLGKTLVKPVVEAVTPTAKKLAMGEVGGLEIGKQAAKEVKPWTKQSLKLLEKQGLVKPTEAIKPAVPAKEPELNNPTLQTILDSLRESKSARRKTAVLQKEEWAKRFTRAGGTFEKVYQETGDLNKAIAASKAVSRGELPGILPSRQLVSSETRTELENIIARNPDLKIYERWRAKDALDKFLATPAEKESWHDYLLQPNEIKLLERIYGKGIEEINAMKYKLGRNVWNIFMDVMGIPRALLSSFIDFSITARQALMLLWRNPSLFKGTMSTQFKTMFSPRNAEIVDDIIRKRPLFDRFANWGAYHAPLPAEKVELLAKEEMYPSPIAEKIPYIGAVIRATGRSFVSGLNFLRQMSNESLYNSWIKILNRDLTDEEGKWLVRLTNWASGRGSLPRGMQNLGPLLNNMFFAPRLALSRPEFVGAMFNPMKMPKIARLEAWRIMIQFLTGNAALLGMAKLALGDKMSVDLDVPHPGADMFKVKIGNTRYDIWSGYTQWARFLDQMITGTRKTSAGQIIKSPDRYQTALRFLQQKGSPFLSILIDLAAGVNYLGEPMFEGGWETVRRELRQRLTPLTAQDFLDALEQEGFLGATGAGTASAFGVGVQTYESTTAPSGLPIQLPKLKKLPKLKSLPKLSR